MLRNSTARLVRAPARLGFTLLEVLIATTLMLLMMVLVATIFALMSDAIEGARAMIETSDRLRAARNKLQTDLAGIEAPVIPPRRPEDSGGYVEYGEGPIGPCVPPEFRGMDPSQVQNAYDTTLGDMDDILMFTTRTRDPRTPFVGNLLQAVGSGNNQVSATQIQSQVAEVAWFLRGTTLYRRQLLVSPAIRTQFDPNDPTRTPALVNPWSKRSNKQTVEPFYKSNDLSVHQIYGPFLGHRDPKGIGTAMLVANSLADLTNRQNRFAHQPYAYPYDARFWGRLGLPTLSECSGDTNKVLPFPYQQSANQKFMLVESASFYPNDSTQVEIYPQLVPPNIRQKQYRGPNGSILGPRVLNVDGNGALPFDAWTNPQPWGVVDSTPSPPDFYSPVNRYTGSIDDYSSNVRVSEDVILTNVIGFDVKIFDPGAPVLQDANGEVLLPEDPGYMALLASGQFAIAYYGAYVDLNYMCLLGDQNNNGVIDYIDANPPVLPHFAGRGDPRSKLIGTPPFQKDFGDPASWPPFASLQAAVYDTWSTYYEHDGIDQDGDGITDEATNGLDDNNDGRVDDAGELEAPPPYPYAAPGIQVRIRVYEPDTQQVRTVTIRQDFKAE